jgi:GntR family transcriptional repressor for pyruvate dehydrogenase complex
MTNGTLSRAEEIADVLREDILKGQYRAGERLPSERDLASRFAANRGAVREALKKLEQLGIADIKPGGVRVVPVEDATLEVLSHILMVNDVPDPALVDQMFEVSGALISVSMRTAIEKASDDQIAHLRSLLAMILSDSTSPAEKRECGHNLGVYLFTIHGNLVLKLIANGLKTQFMGQMEGLGDQVAIDPEQSNKILRKLDAAIAKRDAIGAANAAFDHLSLVRKEMLSFLHSLSEHNETPRNYLHA